MFDSFFSMVSGDGLSAAASRVLEAQIAPILGQVRAALLQRITGTPPANFAQKLADRGLPVDDATAQLLWNVCIESLADEPDAPADRVALCK